MGKKMTGTVCAIIFMVCGFTTGILYAVADSSKPWWLIALAAIVPCFILTQISAVKCEEKKDAKHKKLIGAICGTISITSVFIFVCIQSLTKFNNGWIIVCVGGILSAIIYMIDNARSEDKKTK